MKVEGRFTIEAEREQVWDMLLSPETLADCIPGCQSFEPMDADTYKVTMRVGVAARARELQRQRKPSPTGSTSNRTRWSCRAEVRAAACAVRACSVLRTSREERRSASPGTRKLRVWWRVWDRG